MNLNAYCRHLVRHERPLSRGPTRTVLSDRDCVERVIINTYRSSIVIDSILGWKLSLNFLDSSVKRVPLTNPSNGLLAHFSLYFSLQFYNSHTQSRSYFFQLVGFTHTKEQKNERHVSRDAQKDDPKGC